MLYRIACLLVHQSGEDAGEAKYLPKPFGVHKMHIRKEFYHLVCILVLPRGAEKINPWWEQGFDTPYVTGVHCI